MDLEFLMVAGAPPPPPTAAYSHAVRAGTTSSSPASSGWIPSPTTSRPAASWPRPAR